MFRWLGGIGLLWAILIAGYHTAYAASCVPGDAGKFPYNLVCPNSNDDPTEMIQTASVGSNILEGSIDHIDFTVGFSGHDLPDNSPIKNNSLMLWTTIDITNSVYGGISNSDGGDSTMGCPGSSDGIPAAKQVPIVYNYRNLLPNGTQGPDASPAAWSGGAKGRENCRTQGRMIYWTHGASSGFTKTFRLNINTLGQNTNYFCVRTNLSVSYGGSRWPSASALPSDSANDGNTASRIAKQSQDGTCFYIYNSPTYGTLNNNNLYACSGFSVTGVYDKDHPGQGLVYRIARVSNGSVVYNGGVDASHNSGFIAHSFTDGVKYKLQTWDPDNQTWNDQNSQTANCNPPDTMPTVDIGLSCSQGIFININDANDRGKPTVMDYFVYAWHGNNNANNDGNPDSWNNPIVVATGTDRGLLHFSWPAEEVNNNSGWTVTVYARNVTASGNPDTGVGFGLYIGTVNTSAWTGACYAANCTSQVVADNPIPGHPNAVEAGKGYSIQVTIYNATGDVLPPVLAVANTGGVAYLGATVDVGGVHVGRTNVAIGVGGYAVATITGLTAPTDIGTYTVSPYPEYYGLFSIGPICNSGAGTTLGAYKPFQLDPDAKVGTNAALTDFDNQDPAQLWYKTSITNNPSIPNRATSVPATVSLRGLYLQHSNGVKVKIYDGLYTNSDNYGDDNFGGIQGPYTTTLGDYAAGDQFCASIYVDHYRGFLGPGDDIAPPSSGPSDKLALDCPYVNNKPYFKVYNGSISAGGSFSSVSGNSCTNPQGEGILGGYNNTTDSAYDFGSSADLTAWALAKITGVASSQVKYDRTPYATSLANTVNIGANQAYDSDLGGDFGPNKGVGSSGDVRCLTTADYDHDKPFPAVGASVNPAALADGQYHSTASVLTINTAGNIQRNISIFADHDVYIINNTTYSIGGWTAGHIPSLVVHAKGNIYIKNTVGYLDGIYIAEKAGGKISTCSTDNGITPTLVSNTDVNYFNKCNKQLVVRGSFVADRVNLMRTFGTLRDEKQKVVAAHQTTTYTNQSVPFYRFYCGVGPGYSLGTHYYTINTATAPGGCIYEGAVGYVLPPNSGDPYSAPLYFVDSYTGGGHDYFYTTNYAEASSVSRGGAPVKVADVPNGSPSSPDLANIVTMYRLYDKYGYHFFTQSNSEVTMLTSSATPGYNLSGILNEGGAFYIYNAPGKGGKPVTNNIPDTFQKPTSLTCSNNGGLTFNYRKVAGSSVNTPVGTPYTCAAEVFDFSPEQYMLNPSIAPPNGGAPVWDSVTSLPPVL